MTADDRRHRFAAAILAARVHLVGVVSEGKAPSVVPSIVASPEDRADVGRHFAEREAVERALLGDTCDFPDLDRIDVAAGEANSPVVDEWVQERRPDLVVLYGTSIIRPPLLTRFDGRLINVHLGLSPYYRGSATNFWPLVYREPECVGATIHLAVSRVDAGPILAQVRPEPFATDRAHELGTRTIVAAFSALGMVIEAYAAGRIKPVSQNLGLGRVFRSRDFTAEALRTMWRQLETGMMAEYVADIVARQARRPIVGLEHGVPASPPLEM
jgi:folate-dependent phosphoribosylglycinamide formyltransferase PurN